MVIQNKQVIRESNAAFQGDELASCPKEESSLHRLSSHLLGDETSKWPS